MAKYLTRPEVDGLKEYYTTMKSGSVYRAGETIERAMELLEKVYEQDNGDIDACLLADIKDALINYYLVEK